MKIFKEQRQNNTPLSSMLEDFKADMANRIFRDLKGKGITITSNLFESKYEGGAGEAILNSKTSQELRNRFEKLSEEQINYCLDAYKKGSEAHKALECFLAIRNVKKALDNNLSNNDLLEVVKSNEKGLRNFDTIWDKFCLLVNKLFGLNIGDKISEMESTIRNTI